jgi:hypothetical protein
MQIYCKQCKKDIGEIEINNGIVSYKKINGILASRFRMDGNWGFECSCGNDSRLCEAEKGKIGATPPADETLKEITEDLKKLKTTPILKGKDIEIDNFIIKGE